MVFPHKGYLHTHSASCWGDSVPILNEETKAIWEYWRDKRKRQRQKQRGAEFLLSPTELIELFSDAGITAADIGNKGHQYCLGRIGDTGNYEVGNCRFITATQNGKEVKHPTTEQIIESSTLKKRTQTPHGIFRSLREAERETGIDAGTIRYRIKMNHQPKWNEYRYLQ